MASFRELEAGLMRLEEAEKARKEEAEKKRKEEAKKGKQKLKQSQVIEEEREASSGQGSQTKKLVNIKRKVTLGGVMEVYIPDDQSRLALANATIGGFRKLEEGGKRVDELLGGYFTVLCAVSPGILELSKKIAKSLGLNLKEIKVPSEHTEANLDEKSKAYSTGAVHVIVAQLIYLPFLKKLEDHESFWKKMVSEAKVEIDDKLFVLLPKEKVNVLYSTLKLSGFWSQLYDRLYDLQLSLIEKEGGGPLCFLLRKVAGYATPGILVQQAYVLE